MPRLSDLPPAGASFGGSAKAARASGASMSAEAALSKVRKLLRLARSSNPHEAAQAAARAQEIMDRHNIEAAALSLDGDARVRPPDEPIANSERTGETPLETTDRAKMPRWRGWLANVVCNVNGCACYLSRDASGAEIIAIVGRRSETNAARYIYAYLAGEVERLASEVPRGLGAEFREQFTLGAVQAITERLNESKATTADKMRAEVASDAKALARVNDADREVERKAAELRDWMNTNLKLRKTVSRKAADPFARGVGYAKGQTVNLGGGRAGLGAGNRKIGA